MGLNLAFKMSIVALDGSPGRGYCPGLVMLATSAVEREFKEICEVGRGSFVGLLEEVKRIVLCWWVMTYRLR